MTGLFRSNATTTQLQYAHRGACRFDPSNAVRVPAGERGKPEMINGRLEIVVRFHRDQPPAHEIECLWHYAVQDIF
jgi:hypothetical protein